MEQVSEYRSKESNNVIINFLLTIKMIVRTVITETEDSRSPEDNECLLDRCDTIMWMTQLVLTHVAGSGGVSCWAQSCPSLLACSPSSSSAPAPPYSAERWELARCTDQTSHHHPKADLDTSQPETKRRPEETERRQRLGGHTDTGDQVVSYQSIETYFISKQRTIRFKVRYSDSDVCEIGCPNASTMCQGRQANSCYIYSAPAGQHQIFLIIRESGCMAWMRELSQQSCINLNILSCSGRGLHVWSQGLGRGTHLGTNWDWKNTCKKFFFLIFTIYLEFWHYYYYLSFIASYH